MKMKEPILSKNLIGHANCHNTLVLGRTGTGKTLNYIIPNLMQMDGSYVIADPKGELYAKTRHMFDKNGYDIRVLDFMRPEESMHYNPFVYIHEEYDAELMAETLVKHELNASDEYFFNAKKNLLSFLIIGIKEVYGDDASLLTMYEMFTNVNWESPFEELAEAVRKKNPASAALDYYMTFTKAPIKASCHIIREFRDISFVYLSSLKGALPRYYKPLFADDELGFETIGQKKTVLYLIAPDHAIRGIGAVAIEQATKCCFSRANSVPVRFVLDSLDLIGIVDSLPLAVEANHLYDVSFDIVASDLDELVSFYGRSYAALLRRMSDNIVYFGGSNINTQSYLETFESLDAKSVERLKRTDCIVIRNCDAIVDKKYDPRTHKNYSLLEEML